MKVNSLHLRILPLFLTWISLATAFAGDFFIRDGDRVVFLGDSITEQRLYTTYIEAYALTRHPEWKLTFRNVGWGGDTSWLRQRSHPNEGELFAANPDAQQRMVEGAVANGLKRDVLPLKPTVVTIKFGMNDHSYQAFREDIFRAYVRSQNELGKVLQANGARVAYLTPQPIEDKRPDPDKDIRNQSLRKFADGLKDVAQKQGALFVDQFDPFMMILLRERAGNSDKFVGGGDAVHPGPIGQTLMAWAVLKGLGASALVARAEVDAAAARVVRTEECQVTALKALDGGVSFQRTDRALPMPIDPRAEAALQLAPVLDELNRYELRVTGLKPGNYSVKIDGETATQVTAEELEKGCNLATRAGPITSQAKQLLELVFQKNNTYFNRWRQVQLFQFPAWAQGPEVESKRTTELARLDRQVADAEDQINALRKLTAHKWEIVPAQ